MMTRTRTPTRPAPEAEVVLYPPTDEHPDQADDQGTATTEEDDR